MTSSSSTPPETILGADPATSGRGTSDFGTGEALPVPSARPSDLDGMIIQGRYRLDTRLARGGMSVLYKATQLLLGRTVAVKIMTTPTAVANDSELEQRFLVEARAAAQLRHPNSIVVHDYGRTEDGQYFIVMEYLEGRDLARALAQDGPFAPARAKHIALQVCESLIEAHGLGIVHRDIKPPNVFLSQVGGERDHVKVLDFGLAKLLGKAKDMQTRAGLVMGTPAYMSPEQVLGDVDWIDARSDIYSFGALLFHMLAGDAPFGTKGDYALMEAQIKQPVPSLRSIHPACRASAQLEAVIQRCMAKDPKDRYASMREVADALAACPPERGFRVLRGRVVGIAAAACALGAVLLGVLGLPGDSDRAGSDGSGEPSAATMPAPARPGTGPAAVAAPLFGVVAAEPAAAGQPAEGAQPATAVASAVAGQPAEGAEPAAAVAGQPAEAAEPATAVAGQPADTAEPGTAVASAAAEQPEQPLAAMPAATASPPPAASAQRRPVSRRVISRRPATRPRRTQPAAQTSPAASKPQQPAASRPNEDRPGPAVRRNPDPWAE